MTHLHALTCWQPWATAIVRGWRPLENRQWPPPPQLMGRVLAIHAAKTRDADAELALVEHQERLGLPEGWAGVPQPTSAVVGLVRLAGAVLIEDLSDPLAPCPWGLAPVPSRIRAKKILGGLAPELALAATRSPWASGDWVWVLQDAVAIDPVPCPGMQKVWRLPDHVADQVLARRPPYPCPACGAELGVPGPPGFVGRIAAKTYCQKCGWHDRPQETP